MSRTARAALAAALTACLVAACDAQQPSPPAAESLLLAASSELRDCGLLELLLTRLRQETDLDVTICGVSEGADLYLLPAEESDAAAARNSSEGRDFVWTTLLILGPPAHAERSYGEHNYATWAKGRSPMGNPQVLITRSSASRLLWDINPTGYSVVACRDPSLIHKREMKLWGSRGTPVCRVETGQPLTRTLEIASTRSAYVLSDAATYLRQRGRLRLDVVLGRDPALRVTYRAILSQERSGAARQLYDWLVSDNCRAVVKRFRVDGERPFYLPGEEQAKTLHGRLDLLPPETEEEDR